MTGALRMLAGYQFVISSRSRKVGCRHPAATGTKTKATNAKLEIAAFRPLMIAAYFPPRIVGGRPGSSQTRPRAYHLVIYRVVLGMGTVCRF